MKKIQANANQTTKVDSVLLNLSGVKYALILGRILPSSFLLIWPGIMWAIYIRFLAWETKGMVANISRLDVAKRKMPCFKSTNLSAD